MRKIIAALLLSVDGFIEGPNGELVRTKICSSSDCG
jgi:hypothetical protein